jgi:hypothetical protein
MKMITPLIEGFASYLPQLLTATLVLIAGFVVAMLVRTGVRRLGSALKLNLRSGATEAENAIASGSFWVVIVVAGIAAVDALNMPLATEPLRALVTPLFAYIPQLIGGGILMAIAFVAATAARRISSGALKTTSIDARLGQASSGLPSDSLASAAFYLVLFLFLPAILGVFGLQGLLTPVEGMMGVVLAAVPNIMGAGIIIAVGWFVAYLIGNAVTTLLATFKADEAAERIGFEDLKASRVGGTIVRALIFVPALIAGLDALKVEAISGPAIGMLNTLVAAVPNLIAASLIIGLSWIVARIVAPIAVSMLDGLGADKLPAKLGLESSLADISVSQSAGTLVKIAIMLGAALEASARLGLDSVAALTSQFMGFAGQVALGSVIIAVGLFLANFAASAIARSQGSATVATIVRYAILGLVVAMGLSAMGVADAIVNTAFALVLGSAAVAGAMAFGMGGREAAKRITDDAADRYLGQDGRRELRSAK